MFFIDRLEQSAQENSVKLIVVLTTNTPRKEIDSAVKSRCTYVEIKPLSAGECAKVAENIVALTTNARRKEIDSAVKSRCTYVEIKPLSAGECAKVAENTLRKSVA